MRTSEHRDRRGTLAWAWGAAALAVFGLLLWSVLAPDPWRLLGLQREQVVIAEVPYRVNAREWQGARGQALRALSAAEAAALQALESELDEKLAALFALPRARVGLAADWYYSPVGQAIRVGEALGVDLAGRLIERLFPPEPWSVQQAELAAALAASAEAYVVQTGEVMLATFQRELRDRREHEAPSPAAPAFAFDAEQNAFLEQLQRDPVLERQGLALATSALSALAARRAAQAAAARTAGRQVGAGITAGCISTGLAAWLCAGGVFGITLASTELVLMRLDEVQNREDFEAALHAELDRIEAEFAVALREAYLGALAREFAARQQTVTAQLRPIDLLFGIPGEG
ncbi:MAG: hypothetical protein ACXIUM_02675 [Wenzhouxiangella sp.]